MPTRSRPARSGRQYAWSSTRPALANAQVVRQYDQYYQTQEGLDDRHVTQVVATGGSGSVVMDIGDPKRNQFFELKSAGSVVTSIAPTVNRAPWTSISAPVASQVFHAPVNIDISALGTDADGTVTKVEFYANGSLLATDTSAPYATTWANAPVGSHSLTTKAFDNLGATRVSAAVAIVVNALPTVAYTAPADGTVVTLGQAVTLSADASDSDGTITQVEFLADGVVVATDSASPFSVTWTPVTAKTYSLTARAQDNRGGTTTTAARSLIVNALPTVTLTAPANGTLAHTPANLTLTATAADSDGTIARVEFYDGATLLGSDTSSPFAYSWSNVPAGAHSLTAKAVDNRNGSAQSAAASVTVNASPTVSLTVPVSNTVVSPDVYVTVTANASDTDGTITKVELLADGVVIATVAASPYSFSWLPPTPKAYALTAKAYDSSGAITTSAVSNLYVNVAPTVTLTSPESGQLSSAPASIALTASAADSDGTITKVEYFAGSTSLGSATTAPYSVSWNGVVAGTYALTAKATDNRSVVTTSAPRTVVVAPNGAIIRRYVYDSAQQLCKTIEPETGATVSDYDAAGNLAWSASGLNLPSATACDTATAYSSGRRVDRTYDSRNRVSTLVFPDSNGNQVWSYTPDGLPAQVETFNEGGISSVVNGYSYNRRRLLTGESQAQTGRTTRTMGYGYDGNGSPRTFVYPDGLTVDYAPNALGQPTQAGGYASGISYYPNGALKQFTYGNGIVHNLDQNTRGLPERSRDILGGTAVLDDSYDYDSNGNVAAISDGLIGNRGNRDMTYDVMDRLATASSPMFGSNPLIQYEYNVLDNLTRVNGQGQDRNYVYDSANRLTNVMVGSNTIVGLGYDVQGNLNNKSGQVFTFDQGNRLRKSGAIGAYVEEAYRYDGHGRRVLATTTAGAISSMYGQDGVLRYQEDARTGKFSGYVYLNGSLLATRGSTAFAGGTFATRYQHTDALGSPVAETNEAGAVTERSEYSPYGALLNRPLSNGPGFTGHVMDAASGLSYMQQRYYDPQIGRFLSVDPVTAYSSPVGGFNRYKYAANSPYGFTDPDGRHESPAVMRAVIPGMVTWDHAVTSLQAGNYGQAAVQATVAVTEGTVAIVTFGQSQAGSATGRAVFQEVSAVSSARQGAVTAQANGAAGGATSALVTRSGEVFTGASARAGGPGAATNATVQSALDSVAPEARSAFHGCCGEINAMSNAANAGAELGGSVMATVRAIGRQAGQVMEACSTCKAVAEKLGVKTVQPPPPPPPPRVPR